MFNSGISADITQATATALVVSVPSGAQTGAITVVSNGKSVTSTDVFTVTTTASTDPSISSFSPLSGQVGTTVTILGTNFSAIAASNIVTFNGVAAAVTSATSTSLVVTVPADASTGVIAVTVDHHVATSVSNFIVTHSGTRVSSR
jgi:hypothetical protein